MAPSDDEFRTTTRPATDVPRPAPARCPGPTWNHGNLAAVRAYNERVEREGLPLARYLSFLRDR